MDSAEFSRRGGLSRSPRKQAASRENLKKARAARLAAGIARKNATQIGSSLEPAPVVAVSAAPEGAADAIAD